ncbi:glycoside hydrolase family 3 N-terminal domain-containing protein [Fibrobacter sp. UWB11]|uniref:glycoside hydrolase family 3 N-terminal domain-containing protein n=1 Tax=Fibrobacter sp. UWB11 TaxID=1896202 RepID=UPI0009290905|nr:glycoside hydrolase family 3 N-terminal domain-containing protein [Fibrobacter sp. UWB11]SIO43736.1 beta-N-acetylhexosaminidase [Fibrobacter sp. UWB11]
MYKNILLVITILGAFSAAFSDDMSDRRFTPINSLTESLLPKNESQICSIKDSVSFVQSSSSIAQSSSAIAQSSSAAKSGKNPYGLPDALMPLWESMTLRQKAAQMIMVFLTTSEFAIENEIGGLLITGKHLKETDNYLHKVEEINSNLKIPVFTAIDQEGGLVNRLASYSDHWHNTPSAREMRRMDSTKIHTLAKKIGRALKDIKINMNLAPVLDPSKDHRESNSFMEESRRSWGNDTTNAYKVRAFVNGMRDNGIICVSKHFPGYDSWTNSDHQIAISASPKEKIDQNISFFRTLSKDIPVTMMSSVHFLRISSRPAVFDANIVKIARKYSPDMIMLTDDLWGTSLRAWASGKTQIPPRKNYPDKDFKRLITAIIDAGNDMLMISYTSKAKDMLNIMMELSEKNSKYKKRIEESAARILKLKYKAGILK